MAEVDPGRKDMAKTSAGLLMYRLRNGEPEVLLVERIAKPTERDTRLQGDAPHMGSVRKAL